MTFVLLLANLDQELIRGEVSRGVVSNPQTVTHLNKDLQFFWVTLTPVHDHVHLINDQDWVHGIFLPTSKKDPAEQQMKSDMQGNSWGH